MKKNCINCMHLEWIEAEPDDENGFCCNKRCNLNGNKESDLLFNLNKESYRQKSKVCFEAREAS